MKRIITALVFTVGFFNLYAQSAEYKQLFKEANQLYSDEKYSEAVDKYEAIVDNGYLSAQLFYNLGNAFFKLNNLPQAIANYERAKLFDPRNEDIRYNLELSRTYLTDEIEALPEFKFKKWVTQVALLLSANTWAVLSLIAFVLTLVLFLLYWKSSRVAFKKGSFMAMVAMAILTMVTIYLGNRQKQYIFNNPYAIVDAPTVTIKSTPDTESTELFVIHEGLKVRVMDEYETWSEIKIPNGNKGWIKSDALIPVSDF